jgi:GDP-D-mannose 3', 5'-epimerase
VFVFTTMLNVSSRRVLNAHPILSEASAIMNIQWNANALPLNQMSAAAEEESSVMDVAVKSGGPESVVTPVVETKSLLLLQKHTRTDYIVTGGAGFIGHHMVHFLLTHELESTILVLDDLSRGSLDHLPLDNPRLSFVEVDLQDRFQTARWVNNTGTVIHLADIVAGIDYVFSHQHAVFRSNMLINMNVLEACLNNDIKNYLYVGTACSFPLHFQSSYEIVALTENQTYPAMPESSYGWSKLMGEYEASLAMSNPKINIGINRLHNVYGPGMVYGKTGSQIIPSLIRKAIECLSGTGEFEVWGSGQQYRDFIHVSDVVNGIWSTLQRGMNKGVIQLGTGRGVSVQSVAREIEKLSIRFFGHSCEMKWNNEMPEGDKGRVADFSKAQSLLGWKPRISFEEGLLGTFSWVAKKMSRIDELQRQADTIRYPSLKTDNADFRRNISDMEKSIVKKAPHALVIIIGQPRGGKIAWRSLQRQVLDVLPADLAILASGPLPPSLGGMAKYVWKIPEYEDWATAFEEMGCGSEWKNICELPGIVFGGINSCGQNNGAGSGGILWPCELWSLKS